MAAESATEMSLDVDPTTQTQILVKIKTRDDILECPLSAAKMSKVLMNATADDSAFDPDVPQDLSQIETRYMKKIIAFMVYHQDLPFVEPRKPLLFDTLAQEIPEQPWDVAFCDELDLRSAFELLYAVNYMDIEPLLQLVACKIATMVKNKKTEQEIMEMLGLNAENITEEEAKFVHDMCTEVLAAPPEPEIIRIQDDDVKVDE